MDNYIVSVAGTLGVLCSQVMPQNPIGEVTPLAIVGVCVYFFLMKFDRKMDALMERTEKIEDYIDNQKNKEEKK